MACDRLSEVGGAGKLQGLHADRVFECQAAGVQQESSRHALNLRGAVKRITQNGMPQSQKVDTELVRTAGLWFKFEACRPVVRPRGQDAPTRHTGLAKVVVNLAQWPLVPVSANG